MDKLLDMRLRSGVLFDHLASVYEEYTGKIALENLRPSWLIFSTGFRKTRLWLITKRACDIVAAVCGLVLSLPLSAITALLVKLDSPGDPVFYHQERVGLNGATFIIHKFRTMRSDAEASTGPVWSAGDSDPRITRVGHFLRKTRLDEAPAAVERAARRHEPDWAAARAAAVRRTVDQADPVLRPAARRETRRHRMGAGALYVRGERRGRAREDAVQTCTTSSTCRCGSIC